jgi:hypothetical protein
MGMPGTSSGYGVLGMQLGALRHDVFGDLIALRQQVKTLEDDR